MCTGAPATPAQSNPHPARGQIVDSANLPPACGGLSNRCLPPPLHIGPRTLLGRERKRSPKGQKLSIRPCRSFCWSRWRTQSDNLGTEPICLDMTHVKRQRPIPPPKLGPRLKELLEHWGLHFPKSKSSPQSIARAVPASSHNPPPWPVSAEAIRQASFAPCCQPSGLWPRRLRLYQGVFGYV